MSCDTSVHYTVDVVKKTIQDGLCDVVGVCAEIACDPSKQKFVRKEYPPKQYKMHPPNAHEAGNACKTYNLALRECTSLLYAANIPYLAQIFDIVPFASKSFTNQTFLPGVTNISCFYPTSLIEYAQYIHRSPNFFPNLFKLYAEILCGLSNLHSMGIIHRDMKICNIMIDKNSSPVIIDFGFTRQSSPSTIDSTPNTFTAVYASPESLRLSLGEAVEVGFQTDIWSVGVLFHELLFGIRPFDNGRDVYLQTEEQLQIIQNMYRPNLGLDISKCDQRFPSQLRESDPQSYGFCKQLIKDMLSFDARDRKPAMEYLHYPMFVSLRPMLQKSLIRDQRQFKWGIATTEVSIDVIRKLKCYHHKVLIPAFHPLYKCECHGECTQALPLLATGFVTYRDEHTKLLDTIKTTFEVLKTHIEPTLRADQTNIDMSRTRTSVVFQYLDRLESLLRPDICHSRISIRFELEKLKQFIFKQDDQHRHALTFNRSNEILRQKICESFGIPMRYLDELRDNIHSCGLTDFNEEMASHFFELTNSLIRLDGRGFFTSPFYFPSIKDLNSVGLGKGCLAKTGSSVVAKIDPYSSFLSSFLMTFELLLFQDRGLLSSCIFAVDTKISEEMTFAEAPMEVYHCAINALDFSKPVQLAFVGSLAEAQKRLLKSFCENQTCDTFKSTEHESIKQCFYLLNNFVSANCITKRSFNMIVSKTQLDRIKEVLARECNPELVVSCKPLHLSRTDTSQDPIVRSLSNYYSFIGSTI